LLFHILFVTKINVVYAGLKLLRCKWYSEQNNLKFQYRENDNCVVYGDEIFENNVIGKYHNCILYYCKPTYIPTYKIISGHNKAGSVYAVNVEFGLYYVVNNIDNDDNFFCPSKNNR